MKVLRTASLGSNFDVVSKMQGTMSKKSLKKVFINIANRVQRY